MGGKMAYQRWLVLLCVEARVTVLCTPLNAFSRLVPARYADTCSFYGVQLPMYTSTLPLNLSSSSSTHHFSCSSFSFKFTDIVLSKVVSLFYISFYKSFSIQNSAENFENCSWILENPVNTYLYFQNYFSSLRHASTWQKGCIFRANHSPIVKLHFAVLLCHETLLILRSVY